MSVADGLSSSRGKGFELVSLTTPNPNPNPNPYLNPNPNPNPNPNQRVTVKESGGIRKRSDSPLAHAASGVHDFTLTHCNAGPMVESASIRDPDNLDASYGPGDELTITFTVARVRVSVRVRLVRLSVRVRVRVRIRVRVRVRARARGQPYPYP